MAPYLRFRVIVDLRRAKGNSSNEIEKAITEVWFPTLIQFSPLAVLVQTAAGRLQVTRMFREQGASGKSFLSVAEALRHINLPKITRCKPQFESGLPNLCAMGAAAR